MLQNLFIYIFDTIFPPSEELLRVRDLNVTDMQKLYTPQTHGDIITLTSFQDSNIRALVHEAKFHANTRAHILLGTLLTHHFNKQKIIYDFIIPIPLSSARFRSRGYNQLHEIIHQASLSRNSIAYSALKRTRDTRAQTELPKTERLTNMLDAFIVYEPKYVTRKHIVLFDDVMTTGATLRAAKAALLLHRPASITCIALAH